VETCRPGHLARVGWGSSGLPVSCVIRSCRFSARVTLPLEDISQLVGHVSTSVTETVYRHEIRPALTKGAVAMDKIFGKEPGSA
jgi:integrase